MNLSIKDQEFTLEFRHVTKLGKRAQLHRGSVKAVTTCVIIAGGPRFKGGDGGPLIAIDNALCADGDNFSRAEGRARALKKLLDHCGALREVRAEIWEAYHRKFGIEDCPTCAGEGWMTGEGHDGEACGDCENERIIGGTGLKDGVLLVLPIKSRASRAEWNASLLLFPPKPRPAAAPKPDPAVIQARIDAGTEKRIARQLRRGAA